MTLASTATIHYRDTEFARKLTNRGDQSYSADGYHLGTIRRYYGTGSRPVYAVRSCAGTLLGKEIPTLPDAESILFEAYLGAVL